jgi:hypothetical protein
MCGIAGVYIRQPGIIKDKQQMETFINLLLKGIEHRGKQATGFCAVTMRNRVVVDKADITASEFITKRDPLPDDVRTVLLHTRWATQGPVSNHANNHPVINGTCFVTHNGSVDNDDKLFKDHNLKRTAEVDSEVIAALLAHYGLDDVHKTVPLLEGPAAFAAVDPIHSPDKLLLVRGSTSPLIVVDAGKFVVWASTTTAIKDAWGAVLGTPPAHGKFRHVPEGRALIFHNRETKEEEVKFQTKAAWKHHASQKGGSTAPRATPPRVQDLPFWLKARVADKRAAGNGKARLLVHGAVRKHTAWRTCLGCKQQVDSVDMQYVATYGTVCVDCKDILTDNINKAKAPVRYLMTEFGVDYSLRLDLDKWAEDEKKINAEIIKDLSAATGMKPDTIDWLLHRVQEELLTNHPELFKVAEALFEMYVDACFEMETDFGIDFDLWEKTYTEQKKARAESKALQEKEKEAHTDAQNKVMDTLPIPENDTLKCEKCGLYTWVGMSAGGCYICKNHKQETVEDIPEGTFEIVLAPKPEKCAKCRAKASFWISDTKTSIGWCSKHAFTCNHRGCRKKANNTDGDSRICHVHSRSVKGVRNDNSAVQQGAVMETTVKENK